jgi:hypothetical protein
VLAVRCQLVELVEHIEVARLESPPQRDERVIRTGAEGIEAHHELEKLRPLPIKIISKGMQKQFIDISKKIESWLTKDNEADISELINELNYKVYKLYKLTYDEVKVIDPEFSLSKKEYEAIKLE